MRFLLWWGVVAAAGCGGGSRPGLDGGTDAGLDARPDAPAIACRRDRDCADLIACTVDHCETGLCTEAPCTDCCPDGLTCVAGLGCRSAPEPCTEDAECGDGIRCTIDRCRDAEVCEHLPEDPLCGAGESCFPALGCIPTPPEICTTDEECTGGRFCLGEWSCQPEFGCQFIAPPDCDDGNDCTLDACVDAAPEGFCLNEPPPEVCDGTEDEDCDGMVDEGCCTAGAPCTTTCGSMGTTRCEMGSPVCTPPAESCNDADDDCDARTDEGFECRIGTMESCTTTCATGGTRSCLAGCTWDTCAPPAEICNGADDDCDASCDDGFTCCRDATRLCSTMGFFAGTAVCRTACDGFDTTGCTNCGNGSVDAGEQCDGSALGGADCRSVPGGFGGGTLRCSSACRYDTSACTLCGNGRVDPGEECDGSDLDGNDCTTVPGGFTSGTLRCRSTCRFDTTMCRSFDPGGIYDVTPTASYMCAFSGGTYLVDYDVTMLTFVDSGMMLTVSGWRCPMTGPSARTSRTISVSCTESGLCDETYTLTGTFTDDDTWTGTLSVTFTAVFPGACVDCTNRMHVVTGRRR